MTKIFIAIDTAELPRAVEWVRSFHGLPVHIKLGLEFFIANGPSGVGKIKAIMSPTSKLFLDLKLHDIPNTVSKAVRAAGALGVDFLTVHAAGGEEMLRAARDAAPKNMTLLAVTVLTHMQEQGTQDLVLSRAKMAEGCGIGGAVCSPHEIDMLKKQTRLKLVTPGIRPAEVDIGDQKRIMTPEQAARLGADYLVIGRPVTASENPAETAQKILASL